jgi:MutS domain V
METRQGDFSFESPHATYSGLLQQNQGKLLVQQRWDTVLGIAKLAVGILTVVLVVWFLHELHGFRLLLIPVALFIVLAIVHERVLTRIRALKAVIGFYERGLARLEDRWAGNGEGGDRFIHDTHPYSRDLDVFGSGSLFELLCVFRTRAGEETLAHWLLEPAPPETVSVRQEAVQELKDGWEFRERLFTAGDKARLGVHPRALAAWGGRESRLASLADTIFLAALAALWVGSVVYAVTSGSLTPVLLTSVLNMVVSGNFKKRFAEPAVAAEAATTDLDLLAEVLRVVESGQFRSQRLQEIQTVLRADGMAPSAAVRKLDRIMGFLGQRRNLIIAALDYFIFYTEQCTLRAEFWRSRFGPAIRGWLASVGEVEALAALSCYAFEHPEDVWPEIGECSACFEAEQLAHPLLPQSKAVRNDVKLGEGLQLMVLSGPNMSGKSTFVRGIGVNAVLAQCGAPVRAKRLRMSRLAIGASICVLDSLQGGVSRFYAEIKRLKLIADLTRGPIPVLFLLDELLSGTNSHDRLEGTGLLVRALMERNAIGMVTTHDLALARIPETMNGRARNYHFEDRLEEGELVFDFKLKEGVVQTSNALKLMESIGLLSEEAARRGS